jgi:hypothetical protein
MCEESEVKTLVEVVNLLQNALKLVRTRGRNELGITLVDAETELNVIESGELKAELKCEYVVPIDMGISYKTNTTHKLSLKLTPSTQFADYGEDAETEELADSIVNLAAEVKKVRAIIGTDFDLSLFSVSLEFNVTKEGKLQVVAGGSKSGETGHKIKLTFRPR